MAKPSPNAARELLLAIVDPEEPMSPFSEEADYYTGATDCPDGCVVEPDGHCPHGWQSAGITAGVV